MNQIKEKHLEEEKKKPFSEFLNKNCQKLNLLKNFNSIIRNIIEKDLELTVNLETINNLKNEFLAGLPDSFEKNIREPDDKENINTANISSLTKPIKEELKKGVQVQIRKKDQGQKKYERDHYHGNYQYENNYRSHANQKKFGNFLKVGQKSHNRFASFNNRNYLYDRSENFYRSNRYSPTNYNRENFSNPNSDFQDKSIY